MLEDQLVLTKFSFSGILSLTTRIGYGGDAVHNYSACSALNWKRVGGSNSWDVFQSKALAKLLLRPLRQPSMCIPYFLRRLRYKRRLPQNSLVSRSLFVEEFLLSMVGKKGVEPSRFLRHWFLRPACLHFITRPNFTNWLTPWDLNSDRLN